MKQGQSLITFVMATLALALAIYFGVYVVRSINDPYETVTAYTYTATDSAEADGLLIREEQVIPGQGGIADVVRGEGEKVGMGQTVALVYQTTQAQADQAELESLEKEISLLEAAVTWNSSTDSITSLDESILRSVVALRTSASRGDYSGLEDQVMEVKSGVLRRGYTYGEDLSTQDLTARMTDLRSRYGSLAQLTASATTRVRSTASGIFSGMVDGYESSLTPDMATQLTPSLLRAAMGNAQEVSGDEIGKLITNDRWYFAASFDAATANRLTVGSTALLRFTGDFDQDVNMRVEAISSAQEEEKTVVFSSDRYLARTTLLRRQTAELIFHSWSGLRVPKEAVKMETYTYTPEDSSQELTGKRTGVYTLVAGRVEFKDAEVVTESDDFYVIRPASTGSRALRAGDTIIVQGTGLYDGQLLER